MLALPPARGVQHGGIIMQNSIREVAEDTLASVGVFKELCPDSVFDGGQSTKADEYLKTTGFRKTVSHFRKRDNIFVEGDPADSVYYVQRGWVQLSVSSRGGKSATVALHSRGDFVGVGCLAISQPLRLTTATAFGPCVLLRIDRSEMLRALKQEPSLAGVFVSFLINRCAVLQAGLVDHVFNSSEKRLARILLLLALDHDEGDTVPYVTHETLAEMVGTTRSRISFFMNRFRKDGYVEYNGSLKVHRSIVDVLLHE